MGQWKGRGRKPAGAAGASGGQPESLPKRRWISSRAAILRCSPTRTLKLLATLSLLSCSHQTQRTCTLHDLQECLWDHCAERLSVLNEPIEWRIAMDVSGSYAPAYAVDRVLARVDAIVRQLPVIAGDGLCIDSFDVSYYPGECMEIYDQILWQFDLADDSRLADFVRGTLQMSKASRDSTDFPKVVGDLSASPVLWPSSPTATEEASAATYPRRYHIFLTDGKNDPRPFDQERKTRDHVKLFEAVPNEFLLTLVTFPRNRCPELAQGSHLHRGLLFVIDTERLSAKDGPGVRTDWRVAEGYLRERQKTPSHDGLHALPRVVVTSAALVVEAGLEQKIREDVGRRVGAVPCFVAGSKGERSGMNAEAIWASALGDLSLGDAGLQDHCAFLSEPSPVLEVSPPMFWSSGRPTVMPLFFHVIGESRLDVKMKMTSLAGTAGGAEAGMPSPPENCSIEGRQPTFPGWSFDQCDFTVTYDNSELNGLRLPVRVTFERAGDGLPIWSFDVQRASLWATLRYPLRFREGVGALALGASALLFFVATQFKIGGRKVRLTVSLVSRRKGRPILATCTDPISPDGARYRYHTSENGAELRLLEEPQPGEPPATNEVDSAMVFGVLHICWRLVIIVWRRQGSSTGPRVGGSALKVTKDNLVGEIRLPRTRWRRSPVKGTVRYHWGEDVPVTYPANDDIGWIRVSIDVDRKTWRLRLRAAVFFLIALGASLVGLDQALTTEGSIEPHQTGWGLVWTGTGLILLRGAQAVAERRSKRLRNWIDKAYPTILLLCSWVFLAAMTAVPFGLSPIVLTILAVEAVLVVLLGLLIPRFLSGRMERGLKVRLADVFAQSIQVLLPMVAQR